MEVKIKIENAKNIFLKGYYRKNGKKSLIVYFHGFAGWYDDCAKSIADMCDINNISFLCPLTQGSGIINKMTSSTSDETILRGGCYENLEDYFGDYNAWFDFIKNENYENIFIIGHSLACNKLVDFLTKKSIKNLKAIVFLAPQDLTNIAQKNKKMITQAQEYVINNKGEEILDELFLGFSDVCARTYLSFSKDCFLNNLQYKSSYGKLLLNKIMVPILAIIGDKDEGLDAIYDAKECMERLKHNSNKFSYEVILGCKHTFHSYEKFVCDYAFNFFKKQDI